MSTPARGRVVQGVLGQLRRADCRVALWRLRLACALQGNRLVATVARGARLSRGIHVETTGSGPVFLEVGAGSLVEAGVTLRLTAGARLRLGPDVHVRRGAVLNVLGLLDLQGNNLISWHCVIHAASTVVFEDRAGTGELVTVTDGDHFRVGPSDHWYHRGRSAPVRIGENVWLGAKATVTRGVEIGSGTTVAAHSVVRESMPSDCLVAGSPATVRRRDINSLKEQR